MVFTFESFGGEGGSFGNTMQDEPTIEAVKLCMMILLT